MSLALTAGWSNRRRYRVRHALAQAVAIAFALVLLIWSLLPIYNMLLMSLDKHDDIFSGAVWPPEPSLYSFQIVFTEGFWYLQYFWKQYANSIYVGAATTFFTLLIGSMTSYTVGRLRPPKAWLITNTAMLTYVIPASFLAIPFYRIMSTYGLGNSLWGVVAAYVTFGTPYAIFIFQQYGKSIPMELDESARIDGASPFQIYLRIYLPLMAPALVAVGTYALLLAWNDFLFQFLLLSSEKSMTVPVALAQFFNSDEAPWNYMMATALVYSIPPVLFYYLFRNKMAAGLTMGGVKG